MIPGYRGVESYRHDRDMTMRQEGYEREGSVR